MENVAPIRHYVASECTGVGGKLGDGHRMVAAKQWKYMLSDANDEALFDLRLDPYELNNLIDCGRYRDVLAELRAYYRLWRDRVDDRKNWK